MPHIIYEQTANWSLSDWPTIFLKVHQILAQKLPTQITNCKSRRLVYPDFCIGDDDLSKGFLHISIHVLPGREASLLKQTAEAVKSYLLTAIKSNNAVKVAIEVTVAVYDLPGAYVK